MGAASLRNPTLAAGIRGSRTGRVCLSFVITAASSASHVAASYLDTTIEISIRSTDCKAIPGSTEGSKRISRKIHCCIGRYLLASDRPLSSGYPA